MGGAAGSPKKKYSPEIVIVAPKEALAPNPFKALKPSQLQYPITLLAADIGGTNSRVTLFRPPKAGVFVVDETEIIRREKFSNDRYESFTDVLRQFLKACSLPQPPYLACFAVAGVVVDNCCSLVNVGWKMSGDEIARELGLSQVLLINDFEAQGLGVLTLDRGQDCDCLQEAPVIDGAPMAVIGAGTGLGEAFLTTGPNGDYEVWPTEGGHAEFAPRQDGVSKLQFELCQYLLIKFSAKSRISVERIVSGRGIANIYQFLAWKYPEKVNKEVHRRFLGPIERAAHNDPSIIVEAAREGTCELCSMAMDVFLSAYGSEAGVMAMQYMPFGGLFITGGVSVKNRDFIIGKRGEGNKFMEAFLDKGRVTPMLMRVPVYLVREEDTGERGVRLRAIRMYSEADMVRQPSKGNM